MYIIYRKNRKENDVRELKFRCWFDNHMFKVVDIDFSYKRINLFAADIIDFEDGILMQYIRIKR